jgi:Tfp pilus assembly protein PilF
MSTLKQRLKLAKECLAGGNYPDALTHCQAALQHDSNSYDARV